MTTPSELKVTGLWKRYQSGQATIAALSDVSFEASAGELIALTGPSGSGKSTLLHLLGAMDRVSAGTIQVGDVEVTTLSRGGLVAYRRRIGFVFQRFHLLPALTVLDNVVAPVIPLRTSFDKRKKAQELLAAVGLSGREQSLPAELSGGQQQRVAIARSLIQDPALLLADEPTGNLDSETGREVLDLLVELRTQRSMSVMIATHDVAIASRCARIIRLLDGRVTEDIRLPAEHDPNMLERITRIEP